MPLGWHVPSDAEWSTLISYLGGNSIAGGKLKEAGLAHWLSPNTAATNESSTALPGGSRGYNGAGSGIGRYGCWWSSSQYNTEALRQGVGYGNDGVGWGGDSKICGFSVRCLRD